MKLTRSNRSLVTWTLFFCVLFNVFACGLGHGQMTGLELDGVGGQFCSSLGSKSPTHNTDFTDQSASGWAGSLSCPICSAVTLSIAFLFCLTWLLRVGQKPRRNYEPRCKAPPRYSWPSASPRASPQVDACNWPALFVGCLVFRRPFRLVVADATAGGRRLIVTSRNAVCLALLIIQDADSANSKG